jgi:hypothetical protein
MFPMWLYFFVAAVIAGLSFIVGQLAPGFGVAFMALASTIWVAVSVSRQSRWRRDL